MAREAATMAASCQSPDGTCGVDSTQLPHSESSKIPSVNPTDHGDLMLIIGGGSVLVATLLLLLWNRRRTSSRTTNLSKPAQSRLQQHHHSPKPTRVRVGLAASSDCDTASFTSSEEDGHHDELEDSNGRSVAVPKLSHMDRHRLMQLEHQVQQLLTTMQLNGHHTSHGGSSLTQQVQRLEVELKELKEEAQENKKQKQPALEDTIGALMSRLKRLESSTSYGINHPEEVQDRLQELEQELLRQKEQLSDTTIGRDLLLQKQVVDLSYQLQDLEDKLDHQSEVTDMTMSVWEQRLEIHQTRQQQDAHALQDRVNTVANHLHRVEHDNQRQIQGIQQEQQRQSTHVDAKLAKMQDTLEACQEEWKQARLGLQTWDAKMEAYKTKQQEATQQLALQVKGLQGELASAKRQTMENNHAIMEDKKKFKLWKNPIKNMSSRSNNNNTKVSEAMVVNACSSKESEKMEVEVEWKGDGDQSRPNTPLLQEGISAVATKCDL